MILQVLVSLKKFQRCNKWNTNLQALEVCQVWVKCWCQTHTHAPPKKQRWFSNKVLRMFLKARFSHKKTVERGQVFGLANPGNARQIRWIISTSKLYIHPAKLTWLTSNDGSWNKICTCKLAAILGVCGHVKWHTNLKQKQWNHSHSGFRDPMKIVSLSWNWFRTTPTNTQKHGRKAWNRPHS